jgi:hypothetical protein
MVMPVLLNVADDPCENDPYTLKAADDEAVNVAPLLTVRLLTATLGPTLTVPFTVRLPKELLIVALVVTVHPEETVTVPFEPPPFVIERLSNPANVPVQVKPYEEVLLPLMFTVIPPLLNVALAA